jgi:hypothetical protein
MRRDQVTADESWRRRTLIESRVVYSSRLLKVDRDCPACSAAAQGGPRGLDNILFSIFRQTRPTYYYCPRFLFYAQLIRYFDVYTYIPSVAS